jgi:hypothetical protein
MEAPHRTTDDCDLELRQARRHLLMLAMLLAVATASLLEFSALHGPAPVDFTARYAGGRRPITATAPL